MPKPETRPPDLADKIAARILENYAVGWGSDWVAADHDEVADLIRSVILEENQNEQA